MKSNITYVEIGLDDDKNIPSFGKRSVGLIWVFRGNEDIKHYWIRSANLYHWAVKLQALLAEKLFRES